MVTGVEQDEQAGIAEDEQETSPEAAEAGEAEGSSEETSELVEFLSGLKGDDFDAAIRALRKANPELLEDSAELAELQRRAEQRGRTRREEEDQARDGRFKAFTDLIGLGQRADAELVATFTDAMPAALKRLERAIEDVDMDEAARQVKALKGLTNAEDVAVRVAAMWNASTAQAGYQQALDVAHHFSRYDKLVGDLTPDEEKKVATARYEDARKGTNSAMGVLLDILVQRAEAKGASGAQETARKSAEADARLADKLAELAAKRNEAAPGVAPGRRRGRTDELRTVQAEIDALDPMTMSREEFDAKEAELRRRAAALQK